MVGTPPSTTTTKSPSLSPTTKSVERVRRWQAMKQRRHHRLGFFKVSSETAETTILVSNTATVAVIFLLLSLGAAMAFVFFFKSHPQCLASPPEHPTDNANAGWVPVDVVMHTEQ